MVDNSGSAFPSQFKHAREEGEIMPGLSRREWFAGVALQGLLSNEGWSVNIENTAYAIADDMLRAGETK